MQEPPAEASDHEHLEVIGRAAERLLSRHRHDGHMGIHRSSVLSMLDSIKRNAQLVDRYLQDHV